MTNLIEAAAAPAYDRDKFLTQHLGLVHHVARQLKPALAADADFDELVSAGTIGLIQAVDSFDASRGLAFSTFAAPRIRGAILDELRRHDPLSRGTRRRTRDLAQAQQALTRNLGRTPTTGELAEFMNVDRDTLWKWQAEVEGAVEVSIDRPLRDGDDRSASPLDMLADESSQSIEDRITLTEETAHLKNALLRLKEQERTVLSLYYFEELKLHEIATVLEVTESRVSQIRSKALARLRAEMAVLRKP